MLGTVVIRASSAGSADLAVDDWKLHAVQKGLQARGKRPGPEYTLPCGFAVTGLANGVPLPE